MNKSSIIIGAFCLVGLAGCERETMEGQPASGRYELTASITSGDVETRAILLDNPGVRMETRWAAGDRIGVAGPSGEVIPLTVSAADIRADGKTAVFHSSSQIPDGELSAIYPYQDNAAVSGGKILMTFPSVQQYSKGNGRSQPDPSVCFMAGKGRAGSGVAFRNVMSILKIGQAFDKETTIDRVEFRDLSGNAVSGTLVIDTDGEFSSEVSGGDAAIILQCPDGVSLQEGEMGVFYLVVPAKNYSRGVKITFVTSLGDKFSQTVGANSGVRFRRGVVHPVGDVPSRDYVAGSGASQLAQNAHMMTPDVLRRISFLSKGTEAVRTPEGDFATVDGYSTMYAPYYELLAPLDLNIKKGDYLVFDASDDLPSGGVFQVTEDIEAPFGDEQHCRMYIHMTTEFAKAFKKVEFGGEMFDATGNPVEGAGVEIDLAGYLSEIRDAEGNAVPFSISPSNQILISDEDMGEVLTKGLIKKNGSISTPKLSLTYSSGAFEASFGSSLNLSMRASLSLQDGDIEFLHISFNPKLNLSANFSVKGSIYDQKEMHLITLYFVPGIPIAPGVVLTPELDISASVGVGGEITFSTSVDYQYDMGTFGFSYSTGRGFSFRHHEAAPERKDGIEMELGTSLTGTLYTQATLSAIPSIALFGLFRAGISTDFSLKFGLTIGDETIDNRIYSVRKLSLTPEIAFTPYTASLGGVFSRKWDDLAPKIEFDPIWERYLSPVLDTQVSLDTKTVLLDTYKYANGTDYQKIEGNWGMLNSAFGMSMGMWAVPYRIDGINYKVSSKKAMAQPWAIVCDVMTGSTNRRWQDMFLVLSDIVPSNSYTYTGVSAVSTYELLKIPSDSDEPVSASGYLDVKSQFPEGSVRSYRIRAVDQKNGSSYTISEKGPFSYYWPSTPDGPWFVRKSITAEEYAEIPRTWPADVPLP